VLSMVFLVTAAGVALMTFHGAMATSTVGQLLHATETAESSRRRNVWRE